MTVFIDGWMEMLHVWSPGVATFSHYQLIIFILWQQAEELHFSEAMKEQVQ